MESSLTAVAVQSNNTTSSTKAPSGAITVVSFEPRKRRPEIKVVEHRGEVRFGEAGINSLASFFLSAINRSTSVKQRQQCKDSSSEQPS